MTVTGEAIPTPAITAEAVAGVVHYSRVQSQTAFVVIGTASNVAGSAPLTVVYVTETTQAPISDSRVG